jgi:hypothetical protein
MKHDRSRMTSLEQERLLDWPARVVRKRLRRALSDMKALAAFERPAGSPFALAFKAARQAAQDAASEYAALEGDPYAVPELTRI